MIFLDVGAHEGQTLREVMRPRYGFKEIHAFEPMPRQFAVLQRLFGGLRQITLHNFGLDGFTGVAHLYGSNDAMEASRYPEKRDVDETVVTICRFVRARDFFVLLPGDLVVKLNCEGAEIPILDDLIDGGQLWKIHRLLIDFDIRKVRGREANAERILERLGRAGFTRYDLAEDVMIGATHQERIRAWLEAIPK